MTTASLGTFQIGQRPVITATSTDVTGGVGVATAVTFIIRTPDAAETSTSSPNAAITNPSSNVWVYTFPAALTQTGTYYVRAKDTAGLIAATEYSFVVNPSAFTTP